MHIVGPNQMASGGPSEADDAEVPECAVCTDAPWDPVRLDGCCHVFCRACLHEIVRRVGDVGSRCPLCRQPMGADGSQSMARLWLARAPTDRDIELRMQESCPDVYERRRQEAVQRSERCICIHLGSRNVLGEGTTLFAEVVPPQTLKGTLSAAELGAMLVDRVRFVLPMEALDETSITTRWSVVDAPSAYVDKGVVDVSSAPFETSFRVKEGVHAAEAAIIVDWQRRLRLEPLLVEHNLNTDESGGGAWYAENVALPEGLTLARIVERTRPKARVGAGGPGEMRVY